MDDIIREYIDVDGFSSLGISPTLVKILTDLSLKVPTEIQRKSIPAILEGKNVIASAKTGSGKTIAFALPIIQDLFRDPYGVFAMVLTPTRELALQISDQFRIISLSMNLRLVTVIGGVDLISQITQIEERPHIIVSTPGRLAEIIRSKPEIIWFKNLKYFVMDEVDKLLDEIYKDDLETIIKSLPKKKPRLLLFSATMSDTVRGLTLGNTSPVIIECCEKLSPVENIEQKYILLNALVREVYLYYLFTNTLKDATCIVFASKRKTCEYLRILLANLDLGVVALHGSMKQAERIASLSKFKSGIVKILITTDLGSRGLDIPNVKYVINYNIPLDPVDYIHRIGRTARAGKHGTSISLVSQYDISVILNIESLTNTKMTELVLCEKSVMKLLNEVTVSKRAATTILDDIGFDTKNLSKKHRKNLNLSS